MQLLGVAHRTTLNGVFVTATAEDVRIIAIQLIEGFGSYGTNRDSVTRSIVRVGPEQLLQAGSECSLPLNIERSVILRSRFPCPFVKNEYALAVQPIGAPVWRNVGAMTPDRANFLATDGLPHVLPIAYCITGEEYSAIRSHYL